MTRPNSAALRGWKILVPRGGTFGGDVAKVVRTRGAFPIVAPLINFASPRGDDATLLVEALDRLATGAYDWLVVTSATAVDVMHSMAARIPDRTLVAAAGETTASALSTAGYRVDFAPTHDNSAKGLLVEWPAGQRGGEQMRVLWLRSEHSNPALARRLARRGHAADSVIAYRSVGVPAAESIHFDVRNGRIRAILVTSGSVAEQLVKQFGPIPEGILTAAIGPRTARDARALGLRIDVVAQQRTVGSLLDALEWAASGEPLEATQILDLRELRALDDTDEVEDVPAADEPRPSPGRDTP